MSVAEPRLLFAASGTGGHVFPALAVAEALPEAKIDWLGVPDRLETQLVGDRYPLHTIRVGGFQGSWIQRPVTALRLIGAIFQVRRLLKQQQIEAVFTTGGYIAGPAIAAAWSLGIPVVLHESNALPGKTTRLLSRFCRRVALGFAEAGKYLPGRPLQVVGTPLRSQFYQPSQHGLPIPDDVPVVLVMGGSQGAVAVNRLVRAAAPAWFEAGLWLVHLTGQQDPDRGQLQHPQYIELPFVDNVAPLLNRADFSISRAGAGSLAELAAAGLPSLLIPYPFAAEDHQTFNARIFAEAGAAILVLQSDLTVEQLQQQVLDLLQARLGAAIANPLPKMAAAAGKLHVADSAEQVANLLRSLL